MPETLLSEVQDFCERRQLPIPASIIGSGDPNVVQIKALLYEAGQSLAVRYDWSRLTKEKTHTTLAQENQGNIFDITAGNVRATAFRKIKEKTVWDRKLRQRICHIDLADRAMVNALVSASTRYRYALLQHDFMLVPAPPSGHELVFNWISKWWIQDENGSIKDRFTSDTDSFLLEREILKLSLRWRWNKEKGLPYEVEEAEYEQRLKQMMADDVPRDVLYMDSDAHVMRPGLFVPESSWNIR